MSSLLTQSIFSTRLIIAAWVAVSFLGFTTAIYNPAFHEVLHSHKVCQAHADHEEGHGHSKHEREPLDSNEKCQLCAAINHTAANVTSFYHVDHYANPLSGFALTSFFDSYFSQNFHSFASRAPPAVL